MHWVTILLCLVAFIGITKTEETCGDSWSVNYEVKPKTLVMRGSASEGAIIKISIQSLDTTISKCILKTDANTEIKNGEFITPPFPVCGNTGYNVSLSIECENIEKGWKEKIIWTPPEAPSNVKAEEVTESSFFLKWDSPFGGIISTYKIQLNEEIFTQNNNDPFYRAEDLQPNTNYTVRVSARGKEEWSDSSHQIVVRTKKSLHPPVLELRDVTNTTVILGWEDLGDLLYTLKWNQDTVTTNSSTIRVENLTPFTYYDFYVRVSDGNRIGNWSVVRRVQTKPGVPFPPRNVREKSKGSRNISLEWDEPQPSRGDITLYSVRSLYSRKRSIQPSNVLSTNETWIVIEGLKPARRYVIQMSASTEAGMGNWTEPMSITTLSEPPFPPENITVTVKTEKSLSLQWNLPAQKTGRIQFYTVEWNDRDSLNTTELKCTIEDLKPYTTYYIRIKSWNDAGFGNWSDTIAETTAAGVPSHPLKIQNTSLTNSSIELTWDEPYPYVGPILFYKIKWTSSKTEGDAEALNRTYLIQDLSPYTNYTIQVQAKTDAGFGPWSDPIITQTKDGIPSSPLNLREKGVTNSSIEMEWDEPHPVVGSISLYKLKWLNMKNNSWAEKEIEASTYLIDGLNPYTNYSISVQAKTNAGYGAWSEPVVILTDIGVPSSPLNLREKGVTNSSIEMEWDEPHPVVGSISLYKLKWLNMKNNSWAEKETEASTFLIDGLNPYTNYSISVQAKTNAGYGAWSKPVVILTDIGVPSSPLNLREKGVTNSSIEMEWDEPHPVVGSISLYKLKWLNMRNNSWAEKEIEASAYLIDGLNPYTNYSISVQAKTNAGYGAWSEPVVIQTDIGVPLSPINLRENLTTNTSLGIAWDSPGDSAGPIVLYKVRWMDMSNSRNGEQETKDRVFRIQKLKPYQYYFIQVQAKTMASYGPWSKQLRLRTSEGVPSAPKNVRGKDVKNTSIEIEWDIPKPDVGPITVYRIRWTNNTRSNLHETKETFYLIKDLIPFSNYTIEVQAETKASPGKWSEPATIQTSVGIPSAPKNVRGKDVKNTSIEIEWDIPKPDVGPITLYRIRWTNNTRSNLHETKETFYLIKDLIPFTNYTIEVQAETKASPGKWSEPATIQTSVGIPSAPERLVKSHVTNHTIEVIWEAPQPNRGPILFYTIQWGSHNDTTNELAYVIDGLNPYTDYHIAVRAKTEAGYGRFSDVLRVRTKIGIPSIPRSVSDASKNATYLRLTWLQPQPMNGPLDFYKVQWNAVDDNRLQTVFTNDTTFEFFPLLPYTNYNFQVSASTVEGWGEPSVTFTTRTGIAVPPEATVTFLKVENSTDYLAEWRVVAPYPGPTTYAVYVWKFAGQCEGGGRIHDILRGSKSRKEWNQPTEVQVYGLTAYSRYSVSVQLKTEAGETKSNDSEPIHTPAEAPGPPTNVRANCEEKSTEADVSWSLPANPNSKITHYFVEYGSEYLGYREVSVKVNDVCQVQKITLRGLRPERDYKISVRAIGEGVTKKGEQASPPTSCLLPAGVPPIGNQQWIKIQSPQPSHLNVIWNDIVFSDAMGSLIEYSVIVGMPESMGPPSSGKIADEVPLWTNYSSGLSKFYQATPAGWNPFLKNDDEEEDPLKCRPQDEDAHHVILQCTLGLESNCATNRSYCNAPLKPDTPYMIKLRAFTRGGYSEAGPLTARTSKPSTSGSIGGIVGGFFAVCFCCFLIFGVFLMKKKGGFEHARKIIESRFVRPTLATSQPETGVELETYQHGRCIKIQNFCEHVRIMLSDSHLKFSEEFETLKHDSPKLPCTAAEMDENRHKNRWMNIFPYDHSRVKLLPLGDEPASDFINANYIIGDSSLREYIASQGPLANTVDDFWRMIWEQSTTMIVMLTQLMERGKVKCEKYWPDEKEPKYYGDIQVKLISESMLSSYIIRVFHLQLGSQQRMVKQMHFTHWPDFGCPERPEDLINFVTAVRDHLPRIRPGPIVVHCSAGVGRTGTFIVVDRLAQNLKHNDDINIFETVMELRQHRINMVQTEDQYIYIHLCVQQLIQEIITPSNQECSEPIYSNVTRETDTGV